MSTQPSVANGDDRIIVFFRPIAFNRKPARRLPQNAPDGGIEPETAVGNQTINWDDQWPSDVIIYLPMMQCLSLAIDPDQCRESMEWLELNSHEPIRWWRMPLKRITREWSELVEEQKNKLNEILFMNWLGHRIQTWRNAGCCQKLIFFNLKFQFQNVRKRRWLSPTWLHDNWTQTDIVIICSVCELI